MEALENFSHSEISQTSLAPSFVSYNSTCYSQMQIRSDQIRSKTGKELTPKAGGMHSLVPLGNPGAKPVTGML